MRYKYVTPCSGDSHIYNWTGLKSSQSVNFQDNFLNVPNQIVITSFDVILEGDLHKDCWLTSILFKSRKQTTKCMPVLFLCSLNGANTFYAYRYKVLSTAYEYLGEFFWFSGKKFGILLMRIWRARETWSATSDLYLICHILSYLWFILSPQLAQMMAKRDWVERQRYVRVRQWDKLIPIVTIMVQNKQK